MCCLGPTGGDLLLSDFLSGKAQTPPFPQDPQIVLRENYSDSGEHSKQAIALDVNTVATGERNQAPLQVQIQGEQDEESGGWTVTQRRHGGGGLLN